MADLLGAPPEVLEGKRVHSHHTHAEQVAHLNHLYIMMRKVAFAHLKKLSQPVMVTLLYIHPELAGVAAVTVHDESSMVD
ncbi:hypothetical protein BBBOND_0404500 [Babesia bigemina]|uniref:Uncharacterized protein n=1 Tax=Babesia bigemina TaxID=5866 RepID=A0A061DCR8_BABBI|nr:hypothetical protein BBBOND_0404500 [Babesia bigemina]CDR97962.1 hypothetical protein BBBOND_0404500 [Babesia bigemina]|eukprot:XP_012770148.1 hypothetical protein BBBOND_0404500 [Babesia bigemina]